MAARKLMQVRLIALLTVLWLLLTGAAVLAGGTIPTQLISLTLTDPLDGFEKLYLIDFRTGLRVKASTQAVICCPIWSADGTRIAFTSVDGAIFMWDSRDNRTRSLVPAPDGGRLFAWSRSGDAILAAGLGGEYDTMLVYPLDNPQNLTRKIFFGDAAIDDLSWSPDGQTIILQAGNNRIPQIYRADADGENLQQLTEGLGSFMPQLSPDGTRIAYISWQYSGAELFIMNADGSRPIQLSWDGGSKGVPLWSPDGGQILVQTYFSRNMPIVVDTFYVGSNAFRRLATDAAFFGTPTWSPDGQSILYTAQSPIGDALYVMRVDGTGRRLLLQSHKFDADFQAAWQPG